MGIAPIMEIAFFVFLGFMGIAVVLDLILWFFEVRPWRSRR